MDRKAFIPPAVARYRMLQTAVPGVDALYEIVLGIARAKASFGSRILVIGAGGGRELQMLSKIENSSFVAVDKSPEMLGYARSIARNIGFEHRVTFVEGEVADVKLHPESDIAIALLVLHYIESFEAKISFLKCVRERMARGACFAIADICVGSAQELDDLIQVFRETARTATLSDEEIEAEISALKRLPMVSERRLKELLAEAGFKRAKPFFRGLWYVGIFAET